MSGVLLVVPVLISGDELLDDVDARADELSTDDSLLLLRLVDDAAGTDAVGGSVSVLFEVAMAEAVTALAAAMRAAAFSAAATAAAA